ncbi:MAG TPA: acyl-CoA dehydrogenase family protein [Usitatibacter sp.]|nr:acyl-CoA dehydrogenase family protein [Usitatibacter sp.]
MSAVAQPAVKAPVLTLEQAVDAAREMVPRLRERAGHAEQLRRCPDESVRELQSSGLMRALQPRRVGGSEMDWVVLVDVSAELARGCASTAWNWANWAAHHWMLALWPRQCQDEAWGADPSVLIASALMFPPGKATRAAGGYRLSGRWPFSSGVDQSAWNMIGGIVESGEAREMRLFMVPASDYRIIDNWHAMGLRGTGSKDVEAKDIFVPEHRALSIDQIKGGGAHPGAAANPGPIYRIACFAAFAQMLCGIPLGTAQGAYEIFLEGMRGRVSRYSGKNMSDMTAVQMKIAEAGACIDAARGALRSQALEAEAIARRGEIPDLVTKAKWRRDGAFSAQLAGRAMDAIFSVAGASGLYDGQPIQRAFRDLHAANSHITMMWDAQATTYGRIALGLPSDNPTL